MKLTRRGTGVLGIGVLAFFLGTIFGARALDAVVVPVIAVLVIAVVQVKLTDRPEVSRTTPEPGVSGEKRTMRVRLATDGVVTVTDRLGSGLAPEMIERTVAGKTTVEYDVELQKRGVHNVGPLLVNVRDSLGLITTQYRYSGFEPLVVYPSIREITSPALSGMINTEGRIERQTFDRLREYAPSDSLRDVHWKTSAKRQDELYVVEYSQGAEEGISIAAEATADQKGASVDAMATATASVVAYLLDHGAEVSLTVPNGSIDRETNDRQHQETLALLARTRPGRVSVESIESADVYILGEKGGATIEIDGEQIPFDQLTNNTSNNNRVLA
jgi:uncharacterized protein (DUF58 family)